MSEECSVRHGRSAVCWLPGGPDRSAYHAPRGKGTLIFTGATASIRGGSGFAAFAVPKFGLHAPAQSMAQELGPKGLHVAHVIVDGMIATEETSSSQSALVPTAIAEFYYDLHRQERTAWTHELDLRSMDEKF